MALGPIRDPAHNLTVWLVLAVLAKQPFVVLADDAVSRECTPDIFQKLDQDRSGGIDLTEFARHAASAYDFRPSKHMSYLRHLFKSVDKDSSKELSEHELCDWIWDDYLRNGRNKRPQAYPTDQDGERQRHQAQPSGRNGENKRHQAAPTGSDETPARRPPRGRLSNEPNKQFHFEIIQRELVIEKIDGETRVQRGRGRAGRIKGDERLSD